MIIEKKHVDGIWKTSEYSYRNHNLIMKSKEGYGIKIHVFPFEINKPLFTLRYSFIKPAELLQKAKNKLDKILDHDSK